MSLDLLVALAQVAQEVGRAAEGASLPQILILRETDAVVEPQVNARAVNDPKLIHRLIHGINRDGLAHWPNLYC